MVWEIEDRGVDDTAFPSCDTTTKLQNDQSGEPPEAQLSRRGGTKATKQQPPRTGGQGGGRNQAPHLHVVAENQQGHLSCGRSPGGARDPSPSRHWAREEEPPHHLAVRNSGDPHPPAGKEALGTPDALLKGPHADSHAHLGLGQRGSDKRGAH